MSDSINIQHLHDLRELQQTIGVFSGEAREIEARVSTVLTALMQELEERISIAEDELESMENEVSAARSALQDCRSYTDEDGCEQD